MDASTVLSELQRKDVTKDREEMINLAHALVASLETPSEFISRIGWAEPARFACVRTAIDLGIFSKLKENGPLSLDQLASSTNADPALMTRILRHLQAMNVITRKSDKFANTKVADQLVEPKYNDGLVYCYDVAGPAFDTMPKFFADTKYVNPINPVGGTFQQAHGTDLHFFPWLLQNPKYLTAFTNYMTGYRQGKKSWMDPGFYPVHQRLAENVKPDDVILVDVGGGSGHDLLELKQKLPDLPGKLVLQDKPEVIEPLKLEGITAQVHDFFTPQPVRGARGYFLHSVLHDWDDESSLKILAQLKEAMSPQSKLLVHELVVPDTDADWTVTSMDLLMMALGSVRERTETDWKRLLNTAGFEITGIWSVGQGTESLIEAVAK